MNTINPLNLAFWITCLVFLILAYLVTLPVKRRHRIEFVFAILAEANAPMKARDLREKLEEAGLRMSLSSFYQMMARLEDCGVMGETRKEGTLHVRYYSFAHRMP